MSATESVPKGLRHRIDIVAAPVQDHLLPILHAALPGGRDNLRAADRSRQGWIREGPAGIWQGVASFEQTPSLPLSACLLVIVDHGRTPRLPSEGDGRPYGRLQADRRDVMAKKITRVTRLQIPVVIPSYPHRS